jgi:hypothetical protein
MSAVCTTYSLLYVLWKWPDDGQLPKYFKVAEKIETHKLVFDWNQKLFIFLSLTPGIYLFDQSVYMKPGQHISVIFILKMKSFEPLTVIKILVS